MSSDKEPSLLEYARYYGLSRNHLEVNPLQLVPPPEDLQLQLDEESIWLQFSTRAASPPPERLTAVKEASTLLAATSAKQYYGCQFEGIGPPPLHRIRDMKHELPLLRTDHEMDMLDFVHQIDPDLENEFLPFEKVDEEQYEGLGWPSYCYELPEFLFRKAQNEKLDMSKDDLAYIGAVLDMRVPDGHEPAFEYDLPSYTRARLRDPITPPLLPRSPSLQPYEPSSETGRLDLWSECSSPTRQDLEKIDKALIDKDTLTPLKRHRDLNNHDPQAELLDANSIGVLYSPLKGIDKTPSPPLRKRNRREDLMVEVPLTPPASDRPPPWNTKNGSPSKMLREIIPSLPPPIPGPENLSSEDIDMLFAEQIAPIAAKAERAIEQEQLQEADTTSRVPVPVMDFAKPIPPWVLPRPGNVNEWKREFMCNIKETHLGLHTWELDRHTERTSLSWVPFPASLGRFELRDTIDDDGSLATFLAQPEPLDPETLIWKPQGLRVLDEIHESDEEELIRGNFSSANDVESLIKKRNLEIQNEEIDEKSTQHGRASTHNVKKPSNNANSIKGSPRLKTKTPTTQNNHNATTLGFSAMNALDQFLGMRKGYLQQKSKQVDKRPVDVASQSSINTSILQSDNVPNRTNVAEKSSLPAPRPQFNLPEHPRYFVASTSFLSNRKLARRIKDLYPAAEIVERDFAVYESRSTYKESKPGLPGTRPVMLADEADIILSPSTGLILTSLQKIKQQALPGQSTRSPVRDRIQQAATRYERLVVLVSRTNSQSDSDILDIDKLDESDCETMTSLTAFLNQLPALSENSVILSDGDTDGIATWIVSLMVRYSSEGSIALLQDETQWEIFLRHAGLNAFAAQMVLADSKGTAGDDGGLWGLRKFVFMSPTERCRKFEGLLGGKGLLERVGKVLDAQW